MDTQNYAFNALRQPGASRALRPRRPDARRACSSTHAADLADRALLLVQPRWRGVGSPARLLHRASCSPRFSLSEVIKHRFKKHPLLGIPNAALRVPLATGRRDIPVLGHQASSSAQCRCSLSCGTSQPSTQRKRRRRPQKRRRKRVPPTSDQTGDASSSTHHPARSQRRCYRFDAHACSKWCAEKWR